MRERNRATMAVLGGKEGEEEGIYTHNSRPGTLNTV